MAVKRIRAYILRIQPVRESSQLVHIYSLEYGRLKLILRAGRRSAVKSARTIEQFCEYEMLIYFKETSELHLISQFSLISNLFKIRNDKEKILYGLSILEHILLLTPLSEPSEDIYKLLGQVLSEIEGGSNYRIIYLIFRMHLLQHFGLFPQIDRCSNCRGELKMLNYYIPLSGGLLCNDCFKDSVGEGEYLRIEGSTIRFIRSLSSLSIEKAVKADVGDDLIRSANRFFDFHISSHLDIRLKSIEFLCL
ncbi:MAG: DNA repair protein RecO [bacterium]